MNLLLFIIFPFQNNKTAPPTVVASDRVAIPKSCRVESHVYRHSEQGYTGKITVKPIDLSINSPTKRGKEKSPSGGHCQCQKGMDDHLLAC
jgi:hypothetical protein